MPKGCNDGCLEFCNYDVLGVVRCLSCGCGYCFIESILVSLGAVVVSSGYIMCNASVVCSIFIFLICGEPTSSRLTDERLLGDMPS